MFGKELVLVKDEKSLLSMHLLRVYHVQEELGMSLPFLS